MRRAPTDAEVVYPSSDGKPIAENTLQFQWIHTIYGNLSALFAARPDVFVAADNLIYPVRGSNTVRTAPDVYVAFGRPKGDRGSYQVWLEDDIFPQVVFEVLSPGNRAGELRKKLAFYVKYGVEEYYILDPDREFFRGYLRDPSGVNEIPTMNGWVSPRLRVRFEDDPEPQLYGPDGKRFLTFVELAQQAHTEKQRADAEKQRADAEKQRTEKMAAKLRALGLDPDAL